MKTLATLLVALVAVLHAGFMVLEMFFWTTPFGMKTFGLTESFAQESAVLAANQGLYNGFLSAGLVWGLIAKRQGTSIQVFFLSCVIVAGIFGAVTAKTSILFIQTVPALLALLFVKLSAPKVDG